MKKSKPGTDSQKLAGGLEKDASSTQLPTPGAMLSVPADSIQI
jgi:hypothetical protein